MEQNIDQDFYFREALYEMFKVKTSKRLIAALNREGIKFFKTGHGDPFVHRSEFERKSTKRTQSLIDITEKDEEWKPNVLKT